MKKILCALLILSSTLTFAQNESLDQLADQVKELVNTNGTKLDANDQILLKKNLRQIVNLFRLNGYELNTSRSYTCDSNGNVLVDTTSGAVIHDFSDYNSCMEAIRNLKAGKFFCDYNGNTLHQFSGKLVWDFSDYRNCQDAIESIFRVKKFCVYDDNTLRKADGTLIYDFSSYNECISNL